VALTQTASAFPFFLLALPAGALGDILDRRETDTDDGSMDVFCGGSAPCSDGAAFNYALGAALLTLALSIGDALEAPTWRAVLPEVCRKKD